MQINVLYMLAKQKIRDFQTGIFICLFKNRIQQVFVGTSIYLTNEQYANLCLFFD